MNKNIDKLRNLLNISLRNCTTQKLGGDNICNISEGKHYYLEFIKDF